MTLRDRFVLGRDAEADLELNDPLVSRRHAMISLREGRWLLSDLGSQNGTRLNGAAVRTPEPLASGAIVDIGASRLEFSEDGGAVRDTGDSSEIAAPTPTLPVRSPVAQAETEETVSRLDAQPGELQRLRGRLEFLHDVAKVLTETLDQEELLSRILDRIMERMPTVDRAFVVLPDPESGEYVPAVAKSRRGDAADIVISRTLLAEAIERRSATLAPDLDTDSRYADAGSIVASGLRSVVCVPVLAGDTVFGALQVDSSQSYSDFTEEDLATFVSTASAIGQALANAALHRKLVSQRLMEHDLDLARRLQRQFLPESLPEVPGFHFSAYYRPALAVGGDLYDVLDLGAAGCRIALGDVSGKGVAASLLMARLMSDLRYLAGQGLEPSAVLGEIDARLDAHGGEGMFATMVYMTLDPGSGELILANAGHLPPFIRRADGKVETLEGAGAPPLGLAGGDEFPSVRVQLHPGDAIVLYSDGLVETVNRAGVRYGIERARDVIAGAAGDADDSSPGVRGRCRSVRGLAEPRRRLHDRLLRSDTGLVRGAEKLERQGDALDRAVGPAGANADSAILLTPLEEILRQSRHRGDSPRSLEPCDRRVAVGVNRELPSHAGDVQNLLHVGIEGA